MQYININPYSKFLEIINYSKVIHHHRLNTAIHRKLLVIHGENILNLNGVQRTKFHHSLNQSYILSLGFTILPALVLISESSG